MGSLIRNSAAWRISGLSDARSLEKGLMLVARIMALICLAFISGQSKVSQAHLDKQ